MDIGSLHHQFFVEEPRYAHIGYCKTDDQRADIFTKALEPHKWAHALNLLGITHDLGNVADDDLATIEIGEEKMRVKPGGNGELMPAGAQAACLAIDDAATEMVGAATVSYTHLTLPTTPYV